MNYGSLTTDLLKQLRTSEVLALRRADGVDAAARDAYASEHEGRMLLIDAELRRREIEGRR